MSQVLTIVVCVLLFCAVTLTPAFVDQVQYICDNLGRLLQVVDGKGNVATYTYDAVGNLRSIMRNTSGVGAPTITAFISNTGKAGTSVNVSFTGTNLTSLRSPRIPRHPCRNVVTTPTASASRQY